MAVAKLLTFSHVGSQMTAVNSMVAKIISNYKPGGGTGPTSSTTATTLSTSTTKSSSSPPSSTASCAPLYGQCGKNPPQTGYANISLIRTSWHWMDWPYVLRSGSLHQL